MTLTPSKLREFPNLVVGEFTVTSSETDVYNCIAYAAGDTTRKWWPRVRYFWPAKARFEESLPAFIEAFVFLGFEPCDAADLETGFEKVAIFCKDDAPTHAAKQLPSGRWSSKLGDWEDIEHTLHAVECPVYGEVKQILRRLVDAETGQGP